MQQLTAFLTQFFNRPIDVGAGVSAPTGATVFAATFFSFGTYFKSDAPSSIPILSPQNTQ